VRLKDTTCLVTGGAQGIGKAMLYIWLTKERKFA
jgi:NAD(P)-dependent dehydrogenase (short-subunit alcohol dehydrogenase family)